MPLSWKAETSLESNAGHMEPATVGTRVPHQPLLAHTPIILMGWDLLGTLGLALIATRLTSTHLQAKLHLDQQYKLSLASHLEGYDHTAGEGIVAMRTRMPSQLLTHFHALWLKSCVTCQL